MGIVAVAFAAATASIVAAVKMTSGASFTSYRTPVDDNDYQLPFRFNGNIAKLTYKLRPVQLTSADHEIIQHALAKARD
jgi:hypothetical protein